MPTTPALRIALLKRVASKAFVIHGNLCRSYDCGASMAMHINPRIRELAVEFNTAMDELAKIDPTAPRRRLEVE